jgi:hypothetical protein
MDFVWKKRFRDYFGYGYGEKSVTDKLLKKVLQQRNKIFFNVFGLLREDHHEKILDHIDLFFSASSILNLSAVFFFFVAILAFI